MKRRYEKVACPVCGRRVAAYVPFGGDGSALRPVPHKHPGKALPCVGRYELVTSKGASA